MLEALDKHGIKATFVVLWPDREHHRVEEMYQNIKVEYLWKDLPVFGSNFIMMRTFDRLYCHYAYNRFITKLKEGDTLYVYSPRECLKDLVRIKNINVFHETTESPLALPLRNDKEQQSYLDACKKVKGMFVISTALKKFFTDIGVAESKITIANMTVDPRRFENLKKNNKKGKYVVYCGNGANNKDGLDELIKAFAITHKTHPEVKLYIVGPMPDKDDETGNLKLIDNLGIKGNVVFKGIQPANVIPQILKDAAICALDRPDSLQAQNGFPTKLGEYLLSETPVVVTKVGDIPFFLKDGQSAMLAEERNPKEFSAKMNWLLEHPAEATQIGKNGAEVALQSFNSETVTDNIVKTILKSIC